MWTTLYTMDCTSRMVAHRKCLRAEIQTDPKFLGRAARSLLADTRNTAGTVLMIDRVACCGPNPDAGQLLLSQHRSPHSDLVVKIAVAHLVEGCHVADLDGVDEYPLHLDWGVLVAVPGPHIGRCLVCAASVV